MLIHNNSPHKEILFCRARCICCSGGKYFLTTQQTIRSSLDRYLKTRVWHKAQNSQQLWSVLFDEISFLVQISIERI